MVDGMKIGKGICIIASIFLGAIVMIGLNWYNNYIFVEKIVIESQKNNLYIGIIDGTLSNEYSCIKDVNIKGKNDKSAHGDEILKFIEKISNVEVFYYNATSEKGIINTENILSGLEWLKDRGVSHINISLSSKLYSPEIAEWINKHKEIKIYASYNNILQSADYPAMYESVIGSGINIEVMKDEKDVIYKSNKIIYIDDFTRYEGNSFLSILTMLRDIKSELHIDE